MIKSAIWKTLYSRWRSPAGEARPGYSLLLLIPGDLPVFLRIALAVCARQRGERLVETLVIPDRQPKGFAGLVDRFTADWPHRKPRIVSLGPIDRLVVERMRNPHFNCWLQFVNGVNASRATHAVWHDADLFINDGGFLDEQHKLSTERGLACMGVSPVWDEWFRKRGLEHVTATWELMWENAWVRSFAPWMHRGHDGEFKGETHTFDITLLPQALTAPERVGRRERTESFVHFNYVISTYRWFQKSEGPFDDSKFRLLLVRLLIEAFDDSGWEYEVPGLDELARGVGDRTRRVFYDGAEAEGAYGEFRGKLERLIALPMLTPRQAEVIRSGVAPFDRMFGAARREALAASA